jgi:hypothetical protein
MFKRLDQTNVDAQAVLLDEFQVALPLNCAFFPTLFRDDIVLINDNNIALEPVAMILSSLNHSIVVYDGI